MGLWKYAEAKEASSKLGTLWCLNIADLVTNIKLTVVMWLWLLPATVLVIGFMHFLLRTVFHRFGDDVVTEKMLLSPKKCSCQKRVSLIQRFVYYYYNLCKLFLFNLFPLFCSFCWQNKKTIRIIPRLFFSLLSISSLVFSMYSLIGNYIDKAFLNCI